MRYNPPPNWPAPPSDWDPPPGWTPDPTWPAPPDGWQLFLDDDAAAEPAARTPFRPVPRAAAGRPDDEGDDYTGAHRRPSNDEVEETAAPNPGAPPAPSGVEVTADQLTVEHLGRKVIIKWPDDLRYEIGTIALISADSVGINVHLGGAGPIQFMRDHPRGGPANPLLYVSM